MGNLCTIKINTENQIYFHACKQLYFSFSRDNNLLLYLLSCKMASFKVVFIMKFRNLCCTLFPNSKQQLNSLIESSNYFYLRGKIVPASYPIFNFFQNYSGTIVLCNRTNYHSTYE